MRWALRRSTGLHNAPLRILRPTKWRIRVARVDQTLQTVSFKDVEHMKPPFCNILILSWLFCTPSHNSPCCLCLTGRIFRNIQIQPVRVYASLKCVWVCVCVFSKNTNAHEYTSAELHAHSLSCHCSCHQWFSQCSPNQGAVVKILKNRPCTSSVERVGRLQGVSRYGH